MPGSPMDQQDFPMLLDANYRAIREQELADQEDIIPAIYNVIGSDRRTEQFGELGAMGSWAEFDGLVTYDTIVEEYNVIGQPRVYVTGLRLTRELVDDDLTAIMRGDRYRIMVRSGVVTRQENATRLFENFYINDTYYYSRSEGVPLASTAHTSRHPGVSTTTGFSNLVTTALSQTSLRAALIQARKFADNRGKRTNIIMNELYVPIDLIPLAEEILQSDKQPSTANNAINPEKGKVKPIPIPLWSSPVNWAIGNSTMRKENWYWIERDEPEYGRMEDFDSYQLKYRGRQRHGTLVRDWRSALWARVA